MGTVVGARLEAWALQALVLVSTLWDLRFINTLGVASVSASVAQTFEVPAFEVASVQASQLILDIQDFIVAA